MIPEAVREWLQDQGYGQVTGVRPAGGGSINQAARLQTGSGLSFFLKTNRRTPADMFACEAEGLEALRVDDGPRVPRAYLHGADFILLEDLQPGSPRGDYWPVFGRRLAALHSRTHDQFGFWHDNYIGSTPQPNPWTADGFAFFSENRLLYQARLAVRQGSLGKTELRLADHLAARLRKLIPVQPASLIHGDLWSGNALPDAQGDPAIIDPAAHYGWAEADLAMTILFGVFPDSFYQAYQEVRPLEKGFRERFSIYNLYHLLNHLNLFGEGYLGQVVSILRRYA